MKFMRYIFTTLMLFLFSVSLQASDGIAAALQAAMQNNPAIKGQQAEIQAQDFAVNGAKAGRYPTFSISVNNLADNRDQGLIRLQQPLWTFGKIDTAIELAQQNVSIEKLVLLQVQRQLITRVGVAYARVKGAQDQVEIARQNIIELERLLAHILRRKQGQLASNVDVSLGTSRLILAKARQIRLDGDVFTAHAELKSLTVNMITTKAYIPNDILVLPDVTTVEATALMASVDILIKRAQARRAKLEIETSRAAALPNLYLRAEYDFIDKPLFGDNNRIGLVLESNFDGLGVVAFNRSKGAAARYQASFEDINLTRSETIRQVTTLMSDRRVLQQLIDAQSAAVTAIGETMASYFRLYTSGHKSWIDVLNIQREITEQRLELARIKTERAQSSIRVAALIGKLDVISGIMPQ